MCGCMRMRSAGLLAQTAAYVCGKAHQEEIGQVFTFFSFHAHHKSCTGSITVLSLSSPGNARANARHFATKWEIVVTDERALIPAVLSFLASILPTANWVNKEIVLKCVRGR